jgi:hypothetical protein
VKFHKYILIYYKVIKIIEDSKDEYVELELCAESQKLFDSAENETDDYSDELNEPDSLLASPSTSSNTPKEITKKQSLLTK